jgi:hypothetical protein
MSNTKSTQNSNTQEISGWDEAIARAESEIVKMKRHLMRVKAAKSVFLKSKKLGMPWPEGGLQGEHDRFWRAVESRNKSPRRAGAA